MQEHKDDTKNGQLHTVEDCLRGAVEDLKDRRKSSVENVRTVLMHAVVRLDRAMKTPDGSLLGEIEYIENSLGSLRAELDELVPMIGGDGSHDRSVEKTAIVGALFSLVEIRRSLELVRRGVAALQGGAS